MVNMSELTLGNRQSMKRINENQKVTLTLGQLKRLVKESILADSEVASKKLRDFSVNKALAVKVDVLRRFTGSPISNLLDVDKFIKLKGYSVVCGLGDERVDDNNTFEFSLLKSDNDMYSVAITHNLDDTDVMYLSIVNVEPIRKYAEMLDGESSPA